MSTPFVPTFEQSRRYFEARLPGQRIGSRRKVSVKCPFHDDGTASMSINLEQGTWFCHACNIGGGILDFERKLTGKDDSECWTAINATIGRDAPKASKSRRGRIVETYDYHEAAGKVVFQAVRFAEPKSFQQRRPDGKDGWIYNMDGVTRVPFNLPALVRANVVLIAEGEKDALNLQKAATEFPTENDTLTYAVTTNVGGAGKWLDCYSPYLAGKKVFVFQDNDDAGRKHAPQVCASVSKYAQAVHLVELPGLAEHGDVSDYLKGHSPSELFAQMQSALVWSTPITSVAPAMTQKDAARITSELLDTCKAWVQGYVVLSDAQATILAAWILHTHVFDTFSMTPYIFVSSPEKGCGKTRLLRTLKALAAHPRFSTSISPAALARVVEGNRPTLFLDELDAQMKGNKETASDIRGILDGGFEEDGTYTRTAGNDFAVKDFPTFCPKCLAGIGELWDTVASRAITIHLRRKLPTEKVSPFRNDDVKEAAAPIRVTLEAWATSGIVKALKIIKPANVPGLEDRQMDISSPLLAIAQLAGPTWLTNLTAALQDVFSTHSEDSSIGVQLLRDIQTIFDEHKAVAISSANLASGLCAIEGRQWAEWSHGKGLTANNLARQLKRFRIYPDKVLIGNEYERGYMREWFKDAWDRFCPLPPFSTVQPENPAPIQAESSFSNRNDIPAVPVAKSASNPHEQRPVPVMPVVEGGEGSKNDCGTLFDEQPEAEIGILAQRPAIPAGVRLVRYAPAAPPVKLSQCETVMDTERFIGSTLRQLAAALEGKSWLSGNWGLSGLLERLAAVGCVVALDDPRKALQ